MPSPPFDVPQRRVAPAAPAAAQASTWSTRAVAVLAAALVTAAHEDSPDESPWADAGRLAHDWLSWANKLGGDAHETPFAVRLPRTERVLAAAPAALLVRLALNYAKRMVGELPEYGLWGGVRDDFVTSHRSLHSVLRTQCVVPAAPRVRARRGRSRTGGSSRRARAPARPERPERPERVKAGGWVAVGRPLSAALVRLGDSLPAGFRAQRGRGAGG